MKEFFMIAAAPTAGHTHSAMEGNLALRLS
jgi:hypothetical protein